MGKSETRSRGLRRRTIRGAEKEEQDCDGDDRAKEELRRE